MCSCLNFRQSVLFVPLKLQKTTGVHLPPQLIILYNKNGIQADWNEYNKSTVTLEKILNKCYIQIEKKVIYSRNKDSLYRLLNS
ncbi:hypothetical protein COOONC_28551 [Cooperia oncophora]